MFYTQNTHTKLTIETGKNMDKIKALKKKQKKTTTINSKTQIKQMQSHIIKNLLQANNTINNIYKL